MSSLNIREFATIGLEERVPESSKVIANSIPVQSVVVGRRTAKFQPVNGSTFGQSQNPNFKISSNSDFIIPSTATFHFKLRNKSANAGTTACFDDPPALAVFQRGVLRAAGTLVEDILEVNRSSAALTYSHMTPERYSGQGSIDTKNWKWNRDYATSNIPSLPDISSAYVQSDIEDVRNLLEGMRMDSKGVEERQQRASLVYSDDVSGEVEVNLAASYIFSTFRSNKLFPLSFLGQLDIEFTMAQAVKCIVDTAGGALDYEIQDLYMTVDMAQLSDDYLRVLANTFASPEPAMAYNLPIDTVTCIQQNKIANTTETLNSYVYSKSSPFLKSILFTSKPSQDTAQSYATSGMPNLLSNTNSQVRLFIGSKPFPEYGPLNSVEEVFRHNMTSLGAQGNVAHQYGLATRENFKDRTTAGGINYILFSFAKMAGLGEEYYDLDSFDASLLGSVIDLQVNQVAESDSTSVSTLAIIEHTRIMRIGGGRVEMKG